MKKLLLPIILIVTLLTCGCSAERIAQAIDEDLGTNSQSIGSNIDKKADEITEKYGKGIESGDTTEVAKDVTGFIIDKVAEIAENATKEETSGSAAKTNEESNGQSNLEKMTLVSVTDGDTIVALGEDSFEYRIRLIGIDTPESVNADESKNNEYGTMASTYTKELLKDVDTIYIETDAEMYDKYSRLLAYVWLRNDTSDLNFMANAIIAKNGYCRQMTIEPNTKYASEFKALIDAAKKSNTGLWQYDGYRAIAGEE
ncbi:MAG: thermonuclease family protein [Butyrivibrio sp.]|uniref:thermonuclease family protein n=1 Tax=Butyrivibrio sp. TaxID=28121 RepID=UPI001B7B0089|nr:thermonuclease family protein [Butyrivibrio sp.]MBP3783862.1 thermonuclease family protein [Butyrivibrio sp.]